MRREPMNRATTLAAGFLLLLALMPASSANAGETIFSVPSTAEAAAMRLTCTDKLTTDTATTYTMKCGGGGSGGDPGDPIDPHDVIGAWTEFIRETLERGIGEPQPDPDPAIDDSAITSILWDVAGS